ncbi:MAG: tetratricopeptide repeat protein [Planctomycetota bacterium]|jgi:hypothetical protein
MAGRARVFFWRHQRGLAVLYLSAVALGWIGFLGFIFLTPPSIDIGAAVMARALAYHDTFEEVERARDEIARNELDDARRRLRQFLDDHAGVHVSQVQTHAVVDAHELLATIHAAQERPSRAIRLYEELTALVPLHYRAWHLRGLAERAGGEAEAAEVSLDRAFNLCLNIPEVVDDYLAHLADLAKFDRILWVADQYERAELRAAPLVTVKVGAPRGEAQQRGLALSGIPIERGTFFRSFEQRGLARGEHQVIRCPPELFRDWPAGSREVTTQVRFEHIDRDLRIEAVRWPVGGKIVEHALRSDEIQYLHRPHSAREFYAEFCLDQVPAAGQPCEIVYSCPVHELSAESRAIIEKARANLAPGAGG